MNAYVHDTQSDPFHPDDNEVCIEKDEYDEWTDSFENDKLIYAGGLSLNLLFCIILCI